MWPTPSHQQQESRPTQREEEGCGTAHTGFTARGWRRHSAFTPPAPSHRHSSFTPRLRDVALHKAARASGDVLRAKGLHASLPLPSLLKIDAGLPDRPFPTTPPHPSPPAPPLFDIGHAGTLRGFAGLDRRSVGRFTQRGAFSRHAAWGVFPPRTWHYGGGFIR